MSSKKTMKPEVLKKARETLKKIQAAGAGALAPPQANVSLDAAATQEPGAYTHMGYTFHEVKHPKTPKDHKAFDVKSPEGNVDTIFARSHNDVGKYIANESELSARSRANALKRSETGVDSVDSPTSSELMKAKKSFSAQHVADHTNSNLDDQDPSEDGKHRHLANAECGVTHLDAYIPSSSAKLKKGKSAGTPTTPEAEKKKAETAKMWKQINKYHPDKPKAPRPIKSEDLEKGWKDMATGAAMGAALASASTPTSPTASHVPTAPKIELHRELKRISQIESSGGKNKNHPVVNHGLNHGDRAGGSTGLMPITVQETIRKNPELKNRYKHVLSMTHGEVTEHLNSHPEVEADVANHHWARLSRLFGSNMPKKAYAWNQGIEAARKATNQQIDAHPYVQKVMAVKKSDEADQGGEDLAKMGAMNRIAPFNPQTDVPKQHKAHINDWQTYGGGAYTLEKGAVKNAFLGATMAAGLAASEKVESPLTKGQNGDWKKEGYSINHQHRDGKIHVSAHDKDGNRVGGIIFVDKGDHIKNAPGCIASVGENHQRKGLASAMYQHAERVSGKPAKRGMTTGAGAKLWEQKERPFGKSEAPLEKGADVRESSPAMPSAVKTRALHWLSKQTPVRKNPETGKREFLLHRGMSADEHDFSVKAAGNGTHASHDHKTSWTPHHSIAQRFTNPEFTTHHKDSDEPTPEREGKVVSAWISEDHMHHIPRHLGAIEGKRPGENDYAKEAEVIVGADHKSPLASKKDTPAAGRTAKKGTGTLHERINRNAASVTPGNPNIDPEKRPYYAEKMKERIKAGRMSKSEMESLLSIARSTLGEIAETLEKSSRPPKDVKDVSDDGRYIATQHRGRAVWRNNDSISARHDEDIKKLRTGFLSQHPKEHHAIINQFIDHVASHNNRHVIPTEESKGGREHHEVRARHVRALLTGSTGVRLQVKSPDTLAFRAVRHGKEPGVDLQPDEGVVDTWGYHSKDGLTHSNRQVMKIK